jgi:cell division septation protein DedD
VALEIAAEAPSRGYGLQVGAFESEAEARAFIEARASDVGALPVYVVASEVPGRGRWFRVRLGAFSSRGAADAARERLGAELKALAMVVGYR